MLLAIDIGNTNIVFAVFDRKKFVAKWRMATEAKRTSDEYAIILKDFFSTRNLSFEDISGVIISCVVPKTLFEIKTCCKEYLSCDPLIIGEDNVKIGIKIELDKPSEVGADRIVNAVAAWQKYKTSVIIIDFGTATTFDIVNNKGAYIGGVIAPGINLSIDALQKAAAKLPKVSIDKVAKAIGKNTVSAMQAGIFFGYKGLIEGLVSEIRKEYSKKMMVIATGGLATLFAEATDVIEHIEPDLTITGLKTIYELNA